MLLWAGGRADSGAIVQGAAAGWAAHIKGVGAAMDEQGWGALQSLTNPLPPPLPLHRHGVVRFISGPCGSQRCHGAGMYRQR